MPLSNDINHYEPERAHFDRALIAPRGIAITCASRGKAINLRQKLYKFRQLDQRKSVEIYEVGDPRRGVSPYDALEILIEDNIVKIVPGQPIEVTDL